MKKKTVLICFGTRPEAIKMAPLVKEFKTFPDQFATIVCVTGQHRQMLDQVLKLFDIVPDFDLNLMKPGQDLYDITSLVLIGMRGILKETMPDLVLVHGDTTTSTATALAAFYQQIPVGHVEAGLRTNNIYSPWPEELNRQITSRISKYNFCPTKISKQNLLKEGIDESTIFITGNTVIDSLLWVLSVIKDKPNLQDEIKISLLNSGLPKHVINYNYMNLSNQTINEGDETNLRRFVLITGHRRENFGEGFLNICEAIRDLAANHLDVDFIYPMHLNPNVRKPITQIFGDIHKTLNTPNIFFIEPLDYLPFIYLLSKSFIILTDSGGIQEEAPSLGKPVLVMRNTTERPEALMAGTVKLVGTDKKLIYESVSRLLIDKLFYTKMTKINNPYGDGNSSKIIVNYLK